MTAHGRALSRRRAAVCMAHPGRETWQSLTDPPFLPIRRFH
jgi:hypothetical protein